jgi:hypothetical protein
MAGSERSDGDLPSERSDERMIRSWLQVVRYRVPSSWPSTSSTSPSEREDTRARFGGSWRARRCLTVENLPIEPLARAARLDLLRRVPGHQDIADLGALEAALSVPTDPETRALEAALQDAPMTTQEEWEDESNWELSSFVKFTPAPPLTPSPQTLGKVEQSFAIARRLHIPAAFIDDAMGDVLESLVTRAVDPHEYRRLIFSWLFRLIRLTIALVWSKYVKRLPQAK